MILVTKFCWWLFMVTVLGFWWLNQYAEKFSDIEIGHQHLISVTNLVTLTSHDSWVTADLTSRWPTISSESVLNQSLRVNYGIINTLFRLSSWLTFQPNPFSPIHPIESSLTRLLAEAREYSRRDEAIAALAKVSNSCHFPETVERQQVQNNADEYTGLLSAVHETWSHGLRIWDLSK